MNDPRPDMPGDLPPPSNTFVLRENPVRRRASPALIALLAAAAAGGMPVAEVALPRAERRRAPALRAIDAREACQAFHGKRMRHRITGQVRQVSAHGLYAANDVVWFATLDRDDQPANTFERPYRKALQWLRNADEVAP